MGTAMALITINRTIVVAEHPDEVARRPQRRRSVRRVAAATALLAAAGFGATAALADPPAPQTQVTIIPLTLAHKVANVTIAANKTYSTQVSGANTTVPANATTVQITVTAKGAAGGTIDIYPAGNPSGGSGQTVSFPAGNVLSSNIVEEKIGEASKVTFLNNSAGSAVVTATLNGYSTQVTYADINGAGGTNGQVLTNTGTGTQWTTPNFAPGPANAGSTGDLLTKTATGSQWTTPNYATAPTNAGTPGDLLMRTPSGSQWTTPNYAPSPTNTIVIHPTGDYFANGDALRAALTTPGKYLVEIEGGNYYLGSAPLEFSTQKVLMGPGPDAAFITASGNISLNAGEISGVTLDFDGSGHLVADIGTSNLRNMEIDNEGDVANVTSMGLEVGTGATVSLYNSVIEAVSRTASTPSVAVLVNPNSNIFIRNSEITAFNNVPGPAATALSVFAFANVVGSRVQADGATATSSVILTHNNGNSVEINQSQVETVPTDVALNALNGSIRVGGSLIDGTAVHSGTGSTLCVDDYTRGYVARPTTC